VCTVCGVTYDNLPVLSSPPNEFVRRKNFSYKRVTHFVNWLKRLQAQDTRKIPAKVLELVKGEPASQVRRILKQHGYSKYYSSIPSLLQQSAPTLPRVLEEELVRDFKSVELTFQLVKDKKRKNMFPYAYLLHKLFQLHNVPQNFYLRVTTNPRTLSSYDRVWLQLCVLLGWQFIPSEPSLYLG
jgi:hypothetical protein